MEVKKEEIDPLECAPQPTPNQKPSKKVKIDFIVKLTKSPTFHCCKIVSHKCFLNSLGHICSLCSTTLNYDNENEKHFCVQDLRLTCPYCMKENLTKDDYEKHYHEHLPDSKIPWNCPECNSTFTKFYDLIKHINWHKSSFKKSNFHFCCHCGKSLTSPKGTAIHEEKCKIKDVLFMCKKCNIFLVGDENLVFHLKQKHFELYGGEIYKCNMCEVGFKTANSLENHMSLMHTLNDYKCETCKEIFATKAGLKMHKAEKHEGNRVKVQCKFCYSFIIEANMSLHEQNCRGLHRKILQCEQCEYSTPYGREALDRHIERVHEKVNKYCVHCGKKFAILKTCLKHEKTCQKRLEKENQLIQCEMCCKTELGVTRMKIHMLKVHYILPPEGVTCQHCDKGFMTQKKLNEHLKFEHPNDLQMAQVKCFCQKCQVTFSKAQDLNNHLLFCLEEGLKTLSCPICLDSKIWHSSMALKKHAMEEHRKNIAICEICDSTFSSLALFRSHMSYKHKVRPKSVLKCNHCHQEFSKTLMLNRHKLKAHNDLKVPHYTCSYCGKKMVTKQGMERHENVAHIKPNEHKCNFCNYKSYDDQNLESHVRFVHLNDKRFTCDICSKVFAYKRGLVKHKNKHHPKKQPIDSL